MQQHHQMDVTVSGNGELSVKVHYRDHVPNLLARFSDEVRKRASRFVWWKTRYERKLLKKNRDLPDWAKATIRQHLLHERAVRIESRMQRQADLRRLKDQRRVVRIDAFYRLRAQLHDHHLGQALSRLQPSTSSGLVDPQLETLVAPPTASVLQSERAMSEKPASLKPAPELTLTEQFAKDTTALAAIPRADSIRDRGR